MTEQNRQTGEPQKSFGEWFLEVWGTHFLKLLGVNLLFLIACIPLITIPAAICGLNAVVQIYYREKHSKTVIRTFIHEFTDAFLSRTCLTLLVITAPITLSALLFYVVSNTVWLVISAFSLALAMVILSWFLPQLVFLTLTPVQALKNALIFTCIDAKRNFFLILIHAVELTVLVFGMPLSLFSLIFMPVMHVVLVTGIVMPVLNERLVRGDKSIDPPQ